jgi:undecaprenyl-phosphate 4-deoxy-4-formamido-L-arabinose transferase
MMPDASAPGAETARAASALPIAPPPADPVGISIVVPVYQGEKTLPALIAEIEGLTAGVTTPAGRPFRVAEVILVHDVGPDDSAEVMKALAERCKFVATIWLSRNYGQHPATLAGMAATVGDWVVTLDEDGQFNPADIGAMLDRALDNSQPLVYAAPLNEPPHGWARNAASRLAKWICSVITGDPHVRLFHSFRLIRGDIARSLAAYCGPGTYLDVALLWVVQSVDTCPVTLRHERGRPSGYSTLKLILHFWRLILCSGTRPLRVIAFFGLFSILVGLYMSGRALWEKLHYQIPVQGWTSLMIALCFFSGVSLFMLAVVVEYLGHVLSLSMGKPLYLTVSQSPPQKVRRREP